MSVDMRMVGLLLQAVVLCGCTVQSPEASSAGSARVEQNERPKSPPVTWPVTDLAGRWASTAIVSDPPRVSLKEGYSHVELDVGRWAMNCFVYDEPFDAGQATSRLLNAVETGIKFERVGVSDVRAIAGNPVVFLEAPYVTTAKPQGKRGVIRVAVTPRMRFPVVCTQEQDVGSAKEAMGGSAFAADVARFLSNMSPETNFARATTPRGGTLLVSELWVEGGNDSPSGFTLFRAYREAEGKISSLSTSAFFLSNTERGFVTVDSVATELSDDVGLISGRWLSIVDAEPLVLVELQRETGPEGFAYRFTGRKAGKPLSGLFRAKEPLRSAYFGFQALYAREPAVRSVSYLKYSPFYLEEEDHTRPTEVHFAFREDGSVEVGSGDGAAIGTLGDDGLISHLRGTGHGRGGNSTLLERRIYPAADKPLVRPD